MEPTEEQLLAQLRRWKCGNPKCGHEHSGPPSPNENWRWCPKCNAASFRTHEVFAVSGDAAEAASYVVIPRNPTRGKLASMALRYDHGIFMPKIVLQGHEFYGATPGQISATLTTMMQLHEEVAEQGFYRPDKEKDYARMLDEAMASAAEDRPVD